MRIAVLALLIVFPLAAAGQQVMPLVDFSGYFKSFEKGFFRQIEFQRIKEFKAGDNIVGYIDNRGNLRVYEGDRPIDLSNMNVEYAVSDNLLIWKVGQTLNMWDNGLKQTLSFNCNNYWLRDSIIVYDDQRFGTVNAYYKGQKYTLYSSMGDVDPPDFVGENIVAYRDNGNFHKVFWRGKIYPIEVWHNAFEFQAGTDMVAFNDLRYGTFAVFENGQFLDVEEFQMGEYKVGRGFVVYENQNGDLMYYGGGIKKKLSNYGADWWEVKDDVVVWQENGFTYAHLFLEKIEMTRYIPEGIIIKNDVVAFKNLMGGVSAMINGKVVEITSLMNAEYEIYGSSVLVKLFNNSYIVFQKGKKYTL